MVVALLFVVAGDLVGLAVVDGSKGPVADASASESSDAPVAGETASGSPTSVPGPAAAPSAPARSRTAAAASTTTTSTTVPLSKLLPDDGWDFGVTIKPTCAVVGTLMSVTLHLEPGTGGSLIAVYADGNYHGTMHAAQAEPDGSLVYRWTAPAAPGEAFLMIAAGGGPEKKSGRKTRPFRIVTKAKEC